ncbi:SH3 domain-containing protein [Pseudooceanicola nanhaiensis]|uniref:SH3 domain-containing protein n=1 Tax=Pseudooceanicola nanhaiensis TaxID=375761 RepID=UPI001CD3765A|nr:SH3 domain-containing protein [Pseudooceanicola nanhaiensis]MCA0920599.1 SH3 domain-containing protein [Pseudooceanicola nanhaiensis]
MQYEVTENWTATAADPIKVRAGDPVELDGRSDERDGHRWLWARSRTGGEGWVPEALPMPAPEGYVATVDYTARELSCKAGEVVRAVSEGHGWAWCENADGASGWVPLDHLRMQRAGYRAH